MIQSYSPLSLLTAISTSIDLVSPQLVNHQKRVAYIAYRFARAAKLNKSDQLDIFIAGLLHDIGAIYLSTKNRLKLLDFDLSNHHENHQELGYRALKEFKPFNKIAKIIRHHHANWINTKTDTNIPLHCHFIHLADRIDVLAQPERYILMQVEDIKKHIIKEQGKLFCPSVVDIFLELANQESFWLEAFASNLDETYAEITALLNPFEYDMSFLLGITEMLSKVIDFRSPFTATHSIGVAWTAKELAKLIGLSEQQCTLIYIAGCVHDIGKLIIPLEILDKPGKLTSNEMKIIKSHSFYTYKIVKHLQTFNEIAEWAAFHHERLDGKGYPFHLKAKELSLEARIMAVADVFTALYEDRPYRSGMNKKELLSILKNMVTNNVLDKHVTTMLENNFDYIAKICLVQQEKNKKKYKKMMDITNQN